VVGWLAFAVLLAVVAGRVFLHGRTLADAALPLAVMLALALARRGLLWASEPVAQQVAEEIKRSLRERVAAKLLALRPTYTRSERADDLVVEHPAVEGIAVIVTAQATTKATPARLGTSCDAACPPVPRPDPDGCPTLAKVPVAAMGPELRTRGRNHVLGRDRLLLPAISRQPRHPRRALEIQAGV
jgi:hypothetical protein